VLCLVILLALLPLTTHAVEALSLAGNKLIKFVLQKIGGEPRQIREFGRVTFSLCFRSFHSAVITPCNIRLTVLELNDLEHPDGSDLANTGSPRARPGH
jgi:hypothetical protein